MIIYMFQCYSLKSSHACLFLQSPKDCSLHLCLFCCLAYTIVITSNLLPSFFSSCLKFVNNLVTGVPLVSHLGGEVQPAPPRPAATASGTVPQQPRGAPGCGWCGKGLAPLTESPPLPPSASTDTCGYDSAGESGSGHFPPPSPLWEASPFELVAQKPADAPPESGP